MLRHFYFMGRLYNLNSYREKAGREPRFDPLDLGKIMLYYQQNPPANPKKLKLVEAKADR